MLGMVEQIDIRTRRTLTKGENMQQFNLINDMGEFHFLYNKNSEDNQIHKDTKYLNFDQNQINLENLYDDWDDDSDEDFKSTITVSTQKHSPSIFKYVRKLGKVRILTDNDPEIIIIGLDDVEEATIVIPQQEYTTLSFYANFKKTEIYITVS